MANDLDIEKFIEAVRLRSPLWNKHDPMHRNLDMTNGLWNEIVDEMGGILTVAELKQKWHNLRDCFRREVRTEETGKKKRRWIYYNQMSFLLTPQCPKKSLQKNRIQKIIMRDGVLFPLKIEPPDDIPELDLTNTDSNKSEFVETENNTQENVVELGKSSFSQETCQSETVSEEPVVSVLDDGGEYSGYSRIPSENLESQGVGDSARGSQSTTVNDDYHFAMSIVPHMRQVPLHRKLRMRIRISEVIAQESGYCEAPS